MSDDAARLRPLDSRPACVIPGSESLMTRVWRNGTLEREGFPFEEISDYLAQDDCLVWADICAPDAARLHALADELDLDPHAVEDATTHRERPKAVRYASHFFISAHPVSYDRDTASLRLTQVSAFAVKRGVFTVRQDDRFDMMDVLKRWDENTDLLKLGPHALIYGLLDHIVDGHFEAVQELDDDIEEIEDVLFDDSAALGREIHVQTFALRKSLVALRRAVLPMREVVSSIMRNSEQAAMGSDLGPYYADLYDHVLRASEWTESLRDMVSTIFETSLSLADSRLNTIMKKLTAGAALIAVPTAVTGFYGQNVPYPGFGREWGFATSMVLMVVIVLVLWRLFKRRDWL